jgi:hypothetical protein
MARIDIMHTTIGEGGRLHKVIFLFEGMTAVRQRQFSGVRNDDPFNAVIRRSTL